MKRFMLMLIVLLLCVSLLGGCTKPASPSPADGTTSTSATTTATTTTARPSDEWDESILSKEDLVQLVTDYNVILPLRKIDFENAVPITQALFYFISHNDLADIEPPQEYAEYLLDTDTALPCYKIPTSIVDEWLLNVFTALDYTELDPAKVEDDCYLLYAGGIGSTPCEYGFRNVVITGDTLSFVCDQYGVPYIDETTLLTQKFLLTKKGDVWTITSVERLYDYMDEQ